MKKFGFTLIELSIVLVIIALIVGGILVGKDLIDAAATRAQISQIEKYQAAANAFRLKYGYLPGDVPEPNASGYGGNAGDRGFGFTQRQWIPCSPDPSPCRGQGDGNGVLEGRFNGITTAINSFGDLMGGGETALFWHDLGDAKMVDGTFVGTIDQNSPGPISLTAAPYVKSVLPAGKIGNGNYVYVWSGSPATSNNQANTTTAGINYFGLSAVMAASCCSTSSAPGLSVAQAYNIDSKIDDGLPQTGRVVAAYVGYNNGSTHSGIWWAAGGTYIANTLPPHAGAANTAATIVQPFNCYDNGGVAGVQHYAMYQSSAINCALSFRFQ